MYTKNVPALICYHTIKMFVLTFYSTNEKSSRRSDNSKNSGTIRPGINGDPSRVRGIYRQWNYHGLPDEKIYSRVRGMHSILLSKMCLMIRSIPAYAGCTIDVVEVSKFKGFIPACAGCTGQKIESVLFVVGFIPACAGCTPIDHVISQTLSRFIPACAGYTPYINAGNFRNFRFIPAYAGHRCVI